MDFTIQSYFKNLHSPNKDVRYEAYRPIAKQLVDYHYYLNRAG